MPHKDCKCVTFFMKCRSYSCVDCAFVAMAFPGVGTFFAGIQAQQITAYHFMGEFWLAGVMLLQPQLMFYLRVCLNFEVHV